MGLLSIGFYIWSGLLVLKMFNMPGVREFTWGDLFLIPVIVFVYRSLLFIFQFLILPIIGILVLWGIVNLLGHFNLPTGS